MVNIHRDTNCLTIMYSPYGVRAKSLSNNYPWAKLFQPWAVEIKEMNTKLQYYEQPKLMRTILS